MNTFMSDQTFQEGTGLSRVEYAYQKIKRNIATNIFPSGFQILEPDLAVHLGVSRTPVREALIRLEAERIVQLIPRRGMRVLPIGESDIAELTEFLFVMQSAVVARISEEGFVANFSKLEAQLALVKNNLYSSPADWVSAVHRLHIVFVELAQNSRLTYAVEGALDQLRRADFLLTAFVDNRESLFLILENIFLQLKRREFDGALESFAAYRSQIDQLFESAKEKYRMAEL